MKVNGTEMNLNRILYDIMGHSAKALMSESFYEEVWKRTYILSGKTEAQSRFIYSTDRTRISSLCFVFCQGVFEDPIKDKFFSEMLAEKFDGIQVINCDSPEKMFEILDEIFGDSEECESDEE